MTRKNTQELLEALAQKKEALIKREKELLKRVKSDQRKKDTREKIEIGGFIKSFYKEVSFDDFKKDFNDLFKAINNRPDDQLSETEKKLKELYKSFVIRMKEKSESK